MYGAINPPTTGNRTFQQFAANVLTTEEPGLGAPVPFTPPSASSSSSSGAANPTNTNSVRPASGTATPTSNGAATPSSNNAAPSQSTGAAGSVTARSTFVLGLAGLAAGLVL
jgi:hypothetical protein